MSVLKERLSWEMKVVPAKPDLSMVRRLHRGRNSSVCFAGYDEKGDWKQHCNVLAEHLALMVPEEILERDAFYTVNGFFHGKVNRVPHAEGEAFPDVELLPPRGPAYRRRQGVKWLNAAYVDVDCGHKHGVGLTEGQVIGAVHDLSVSSRVIPQPSLIKYSGRGVWFFWFLRDGNEPDAPQRAYVEHVCLYERLNEAIQRKLLIEVPKVVQPSVERWRALDRQCKDVTRGTRVEGSLNTAADARVGYYENRTALGAIRAYTLRQLCDWFKVEPETAKPVRSALEHDRPRINEEPRDADAVLTPRQRGGINRWREALAQFSLLMAIRSGGFQDGCRHLGAFYLATLIRNNKGRWAEAFREVAKFGKACRPPLKEKEIVSAVNQALRPTGGFKKFPSNEVLIDVLGITKKEGERLEASFNDRAWSPHLPQRKPRRKTPKRKDIEARRKMIQGITEERGWEILPRRDMAKALSLRGLECSHQTVHHDYRAMGSPWWDELPKRVPVV